MTYEQVEELLKGLEYSHREEIDYSHENVVHVILEAVEKGSIEFQNWIIDNGYKFCIENDGIKYYSNDGFPIENISTGLPIDQLYKLYLQDQNKK